MFKIQIPFHLKNHLKNHLKAHLKSLTVFMATVSLTTMVALSATTLMAQEAGAPPPQGPSIWESFVIPMLAFFLIFFFLVIRPQAKKAKEAQDVLKSLKKGDQVLTSCGILGTIVGMSEVFIDLKASDTTRFKVLKNTVTPYKEKAKS